MYERIFRRLRSFLLVGAAMVVVTLVLAGAIYGFIQYGGNLHAVEVGTFYRSAQLSGEDLRQVIKAKQIRTVLNLRGKNSGKDWYDEEIHATDAEGVLHLDYSLSARREVTLTQMQDIMRLIKASPKPILVHCNAGADRTGLVSALFELSKGKDPLIAGEQLSLRYGHFPYLGSKTIAMDRSFASFAQAGLASASGNIEADVGFPAAVGH
jgi:protein tyrosine/serine phosphatase